MTAIFTFFERQFVPFGAIGVSSNDPLVEILDRLNQKAGQELIRIERRGLQVLQYVGVIQAASCTIQILPKVDCDPQANMDTGFGSFSYERAASSAARNFLYLLLHAQQLKLHHQCMATLKTHQGDWFEMLTHLFATELSLQVQEGFNQDYIRREDQLPYIRGRWNIARQYAHQPNLMQSLDVSFDDYLPDIPINRFFRWTVDRLKARSRDAKNRQLLADLNLWLQPVSLPAQIAAEDLKGIHFNRLNERFYPAFQLAKMFLEGQTVQLMSGKQKATAFLFDMNRLFEQFVANFLVAYQKKILPSEWSDLPAAVQGGASRKFLIAPPSESPMFPLRPDILLGSPEMPVLIIDTKNKALPLTQSHRAVAESDAYQMLAYATQYRCPNILLLYPHTLGGELFSPRILPIARSPIRLFVAAIDLHQPLDQITPLIQAFRTIFYAVFSQVKSSSEG